MEGRQEIIAEREWGLEDYFSLAVRRKWIILIVFSAVFAASLFYIFTRPPIYLAGSTFIIENSPSTYSRSSSFYYMRTGRPFAFYDTMIKSRVFIERVMEAAYKDSELASCPDFNGETLNAAIAALKLEADKSDDNYFESYSILYTLTVQASHPVIAYRIADIATNEFKRRCREIELEESRNVVDYVNVQIEEARKNLEQAERELQEFKDRTKMADIDQIEGGLLKKLSEIENELEQVQTQRQLAQANLNAYQARFSSMKSGGSTLSDFGTESPEVKRIRSQIETMEAERRRIAESEGISSPALAALENRIEAEKGKLRQAILSSRERTSSMTFGREGDNAKDIFNERIVNEELNLFSLNNKEQFLRSLIERYRAQNPNLLENAIQLAQLQRTKKVNENLYTFLIEKAEEAKINAATGSGGVRIVDEPSLPTRPVSANRKRNLAVAFILSLGLAFGAAFLRDYFDSSIYTVEDLRHLGDVTVLGTIPFIDIEETKPKTKKNGKNGSFAAVNELYLFEDRMNGYKNKVISMVQSQEPLVDAYRHVRTNLQFSDVDTTLRRILITSSIPGEGKTLTAANLAISFAELGKRALVVDADLRRPHQHILFNVRKTPGLTDYLANNLPLEKIIYLTHVTNVFVIPAGSSTPNPAMMLASERMNELIRRLEQNFDFVIYDTPPIIAVTDPVLLSKHIGKAVMVVRFGSTNRHVVKDAFSRLQFVKTKIVGVVLNGMERSKGYGYYKYNYSYYHNAYYTEETRRRTPIPH